MIPRHFAAVVVFLCAVSGCTKRPDGWENLSWGASLDRIKLAYPDATAVDADEEAVHHIKCSTLHGHPYLKRVSDIGGHQFQTYFCLDDTGLLRSVEMTMINGASLAPNKDDPTLRSLTQQFGPPKDATVTSGVFVYDWNAKTTDVLLVAITMIPDRTQVTVSYTDQSAQPRTSE